MPTKSAEKRAQHNRTWYLKHKAEQIIRAKKNSNLYAEENTKNLIEYFQKHPCVDCGEKDPIVLDFDHDDPEEKEFDISMKIAQRRWANLLPEIQKCSVRCSNCHRRKTAKQFGFRRFLSA